MTAATVAILSWRSAHHLGLSLIMFSTPAIICTIMTVVRPEWFSPLLRNLLTSLSLTHRFPRFALGIIDGGAVIYYLAVITLCLYLTGAGMAKRRWAE